MTERTAHRLREGEVRLLALGMALALVPIVDILPPWIMFLAASFAGWRLYSGWRGRAGIPGLWLRLPLTVLCFTGVWLEFGSFNGIEPGSALLVAMTGLKLLESRSARDGLVLGLLSFLLVMAVFLQDQDLPVTLWLSAVVLFQTAVLLRVGRIMPPESLRSDLGMAARILAQALPIALILFALFPRIPGPLWGTPEPEQRATTGLSDSMTPGGISELATSNAVAFRVAFDGDPPAESEQYWRGPVFHRFDGQQWQEGRLPRHRSVIMPLGEPIRQEITLEAHDEDWLLALDFPSGELPDDTRQRHDLRLESRERVSERKRYEVDSWPTATLDPDMPTTWQEVMTELPDNSNPQTVALGEEFRERADGEPQDIISLALDHFSEEAFYYTLEPEALGRHSMDEFLFETRAGFCEHYASAFAVLMRAAGIPTRVVTGYLGLEENPRGDHYLVRQSHAHAWNEVWLPNQGWRRVDPTGAVAPERIDVGLASSLGEIAPGQRDGWDWDRLAWELEMTWDLIQTRWDGWFLAYGPEQQEYFLERLGLPSEDALRMALTMVLLAGLTLLIIGLILSLRQRDRLPSDPVERAWRLFQRRMARAGAGREPDEGPRDWQARLWREHPQLAGEAGPVLTRLADARYRGGFESIGAEAAARLLRTVRRLRLPRTRN